MAAVLPPIDANGKPKASLDDSTFIIASRKAVSS